MQKQILIESQYFPPISYFAALAHYEKAVIEYHENFQKSTYRNRCYISGPNGILRLTVPLERGKHQRSKISDVKISYDEDWQKNHWQSICSCYRRSPYFEFYEERFEQLFQKKWEFLFDLNMEILQIILDLIDLEVEYRLSEKYEKEVDIATDDLRSKIIPNADAPLSFYDAPEYRQVFEEKTGFFPNLSILDLLFNEGRHSIDLVRQSTSNVKNS